MRVEALRERPFRLLWLARTASAVGDSLVPVALAFAVLGLGHGATGLGLVLGMFTGGRLIFVLAGGVWADRLPRRAVMLACDGVRAIVDAFTAAALFAGSMELWMFMVTAFLFGAASAFFQPAASALVPETVSRERLQQANALLLLSRNATAIFGPALSGLIVAAASPAWVFAVDSASFVASAYFLVSLRVVERANAARRRFLTELGEGWREVWSRSWMRIGFAAFALNNLAYGPILVLGPLVAEREFGGAKAWGLVLSIGAIGGVVGSVIAYRICPRRPVATAFAFWSLTSLPLFALAGPLPLALVALANGCFVFAISVGNPIWETVLQREVPPDRLSRVVSFDALVSLVFVPVGQALAGPLAATLGVRTTLLAAGAVAVCASPLPLLLPPVWRPRNEGPAPPHRPLATSGS